MALIAGIILGALSFWLGMAIGRHRERAWFQEHINRLQQNNGMADICIACGCQEIEREPVKIKHIYERKRNGKTNES